MSSFLQMFWRNMLLPWQRTFCHGRKMHLAHLHPEANIWAKFHENWWKTEEVVRDARFFPHFCHNMPLPWQHTFCHCQKNESCTSTPQGKHLCQISWELVKNWGRSSRRKIFPHFCHNMPLPWQHTFCQCQKMCLAHLHPKANICAKFHENWWKTEEVVHDARFSPIFAIICRYHGNTFCHCQKMSLAHLHPKANICAKFHENWWKTEEVVRDARFSPHFCHNRPLPWQHSFCHCQKMCLAHLHPKANICAKFYENWSKTEEVVRDARLAPARPPARQTDRRHADSYIYPLIHYVYAGV